MTEATACLKKHACKQYNDKTFTKLDYLRHFALNKQPELNVSIPITLNNSLIRQLHRKEP